MMMKQSLIIFFLFLFVNLNAQQSHTLSRLVVSKDNHYLQYENGKPFFWLGDTGWLMFSRLTLEEIKKYIDNRVSKGFNVIHATLLGEPTPTRSGYVALQNNDPLKPGESYFKFVDSVVSLCAKRKVYLALLTTWG